jgi:hypothetical protein
MESVPQDAYVPTFLVSERSGPIPSSFVLVPIMSMAIVH